MGSQSVRPASDVVARRLGDAAVLISLTTNRIYELDATGARLWDLLQGGVDEASAVDTLAQEFDAPLSTIQSEVDALLQTLSSEGLVVRE